MTIFKHTNCSFWVLTFVSLWVPKGYSGGVGEWIIKGSKCCQEVLRVTFKDNGPFKKKNSNIFINRK